MKVHNSQMSSSLKLLSESRKEIFKQQNSFDRGTMVMQSITNTSNGLLKEQSPTSTDLQSPISYIRPTPIRGLHFHRTATDPITEETEGQHLLSSSDSANERLPKMQKSCIEQNNKLRLTQVAQLTPEL